MKIKTKKNLLTVILSVVFAVLLTLGINLIIPENNVKTAEAAVSQPTLTFDPVKYYGSSTYYDSATYSSMSSSLPSYVTFSTSTDKITSSVTASGSDYRQNTILMMPVILNIDVPAYTVYKVEYTMSTVNTGPNGRLMGLVDGWQQGNPADYTYDGTTFSQTLGNPYISGNYFGNPYGKNKDGYGMVFYNDTAITKTMKAYTYYIVHIGHGGTNGVVYNQEFQFTDFEVKAEKIGAPTSTDTTPKLYDGTTKTFNFTYDSPAVSEYGTTLTYSTAYENITTTVEALNHSNITINASTYNCSNVGTAGTLTAVEAGIYKVKFDLTSAAKSAGIEWVNGGTATKTISFEIKRKAIPVPTVLNATTETYDTTLHQFKLKDYDASVMSVPNGGYTSNNGSSISWDSTVGSEMFKATDAAEYTVKFHLDSSNHVWSVGSAESASDQSKNIIIKTKELTVNTTPSASSNPNWGFGDTGSIEYTVTATGITSPNFVINVYYIKDGDVSTPLTAGINTATNSLDVSKIAATGKYTLCIELTSAAANRNYSIANNKFEMPFEIKSGGIDFSIINWTYKEDGGNALPLFAAGGVQEKIRYSQDKNGNPVKYFVSAEIPAGGYLKVDTSYNSNGYKDGFLTEKDGATFNGGCSAVGKYKTRVALISDSDHLFKTTANSDTFGGDDTKGWYEIEWEISKGKVDAGYLVSIENNLQYRTAGGSWQTYDPQNPPQFGSGAIEIRVDPTKYPAGVTKAEITVNDKNTAIGSYVAQVKFTYDSNYENEGNKSFTWQISAMAIEVDWTSDFWKDSSGDNVLDVNGAPYQIRVLNIKDDLKQFVEYKYYLADPSDPSIKGNYIGTGDAGLQDLISPPYNASSTNAVYIYVEAVIKSGVTQYRLVDNTGNTYPCNMLYKLGSTNTLVKVTMTETEMEYGGDKLTAGIIKMLDTGVNGDLDQSAYVEGIYVYDSANTNLGLLKDFDGTTAAVGQYTIHIKLNAAGESTYTLTPGAKHTFTIKPKAIPVPTVNEITFNNTFINFADYLGGSYNDYKDIIKLGGTIDGVKNANTAYTATLTLLDSNYCWSYGTDKTQTKISLADGEAYTVSGDDVVATYDWKINPYVLDVNNWNLSGKEGAVYNIPADLLSGLDVNINYLYHTDKAGSPLENGSALKLGSTYFVKAELIGADAGNFVFKDSGTTVSDFAQYKIPQSGVAAAFGKVRDFITMTWMGLPIWAWMLIALAILILLIIIIVVACKKRKSKEEREAIKAAKEEEKQRREEERRQKEEEREEEKRRREEERAEEKRRRDEEREEERRRREEEREAAKAKQEAELELAKAKQEAELARIKAEAAAASAMPAAAMAATALAQPQAQAQPQQVQQPVQQVQQVPVADNSAIAKLEAEIAMLRAENKAQQQAQQNNNAQPQQNYNAQPAADPTALARIEARLDAMQAEQRAKAAMQQPMMQMPMQMPMMPQMPMQMPMYGPMPYGGNGGMGGNGGSMNDPVMVAELTRLKAESEAHMRVELERARTETERAKADAEIAKVRAESGRYQQPQQAMYPQAPVQYAQAPTAAPVQPQAQAVQPVIQQVPVAAQANAAEGNFSAADVGAIVASMMKSMGGRKPREQKTVIEAETQPVASTTPTVYPPDAVITTTTMVDTTKKPNQSQRITREDDGRLFDIDGFYDTFDENK